MSNVLTPYSKLLFLQKHYLSKREETTIFHRPRLQCFSSIHRHLYFASFPINWTMHRNAITEKKKVKKTYFCQMANIYIKGFHNNLCIEKIWRFKMNDLSASCTVVNDCDAPWKGCVMMVAQERAIISLVVYRKNRTIRGQTFTNLELSTRQQNKQNRRNWRYRNKD